MIKLLYLAVISGVVVSLDQITKIYVHTQFRLHEKIIVIADFFNITYVRNPGAAFGFLADSQPVFREIFFLAMPPVALLVILTILKGVDSKDRVQVCALSLVFGGAIGNYIDRVRFRFVIDFLDFTWIRRDANGVLIGKHTWPAFNVADISIVVGVGLLLLLMVRDYKLEKAQKLQNQASPEGTS